MALTSGYTPEARKALSWRVAINSFFLLIASYFVGTHILAFFSISLPVVQVGGALIVISTGWAMLNQRDDEKEDVHRTMQPQDPFRQAFYPLTLPLTVGPGSISVAITLGANAAQPPPPGPLPRSFRTQRLLAWSNRAAPHADGGRGTVCRRAFRRARASRVEDSGPAAPSFPTALG